MAATLGLLAVSAHAQTLLSSYTFDGNGNDGGSVNVAGSLVNQASYTAAGTGVGGFGQALATSDGTNDYFTAATGGNTAFGTSALTIALWVNIDSAATSDRLVSNITASTGFDLFIGNYTVGGGAGGADLFRLTFAINGTSGGSGVLSDDAKYVSDKWLFLAVTYDGANVRFYSGDETTSLLLNDTLAKTGSIGASASNLEIGGTPVTTNDRTPDALFDHVRIYNGALTAGQLEALRLSTVPEPSTYAALLGAMAMVFVVAKRNRIRR
jgi:hypothetical protein